MIDECNLSVTWNPGLSSPSSRHRVVDGSGDDNIKISVGASGDGAMVDQAGVILGRCSSPNHLPNCTAHQRPPSIFINALTPSLRRTKRSSQWRAASRAPATHQRRKLSFTTSRFSEHPPMPNNHTLTSLTLHFKHHALHERQIPRSPHLQPYHAPRETTRPHRSAPPLLLPAFSFPANP